MQRSVVSLVLAIAACLAKAAAGETNEYHCASRADIVGSCFDVRGRLSFWNGAPSARIWPIGTKRMLGVHFDQLPPKLDEEMVRFDPRGRFDAEVYAMFTVCPFTKSQPGKMQFVCIESWRNARLTHHQR